MKLDAKLVATHVKFRDRAGTVIGVRAQPHAGEGQISTARDGHISFGVAEPHVQPGTVEEVVEPKFGSRKSQRQTVDRSHRDDEVRRMFAERTDGAQDGEPSLKLAVLLERRVAGGPV